MGTEIPYYIMKIHEFQAKELLRRFGVSVPRGEVAQTPERAEEEYRKRVFFYEEADGGSAEGDSEETGDADA